ncbi:MAG: DUF2505 family protein [Acidimicrobiales bacterium]
MATPFQIEQHFSAPVEAVEAAFLDPSLLARMAELPDLGRPKLLGVVEDGSSVTRRVRFSFTGELSSAARAVLDPDRLTWVEESVLDRRTHRSRVVIRPDHYADRLKCEATVTLEEQAGSTRRVTAGRLSVRAPLVAGRVERAIVSGLEKNSRAEARIVRELLAARDQSG